MIVTDHAPPTDAEVDDFSDLDKMPAACFVPLDKECLAYIARAASAAPAQNTAELRIKSEALLWLANLLDP